MANGDGQQIPLKCRNPGLILRKLVPLLEYPISQDEIGRQLKYLNEFLLATHYAFWIQDIPWIIRLFEALSRQIQNYAAFRRPLERLLEYTKIPPMLIKPSDKMEYERDIQQYFSMLGYLTICLRDKSLCELILDALTCLLDPKQAFGYCCVPLEHYERAIEESGLPGIIGEILQFIQEELLIKVLDVACNIALISRKTSKKIAKENGIENAMRRFDPRSLTREEAEEPKKPSATDSIPFFTDLCRLLWQLLSAVDSEDDIAPPSKYALWGLQYALRWAVIHPGSRHQRNYLTAIILKMLQIYPDCPYFVESELADDVAILAMTAGGCHCRSTVNFFNDEIDYRWKKLLWACLHYFTQEGTLKIIKKNRLVMVFTKFLIKEHSHDEQHLELVRIALRIIPKYFQSSVTDFLYVEGPQKLTKMIDTFIKRTYEANILAALLYCLDEILRQKVAEVEKVFLELDTFPVLIRVTYYLVHMKGLDRRRQHCIARAFCILYNLALIDPDKIEKNCITLCCDYLQRSVQPFVGDPCIDIRITICALHFLWLSLMTHNHLIDDFINLNGIYLVLDVVKMHSLPVKCMGLGVLVDLCRTCALSVPYFITWRKRCHGLVVLLLEVFRGRTEIDCHKPQLLEFSRDVKNRNNYLRLCEGLKSTTMDLKVEDLVTCVRFRIVGIFDALRAKYRDKVEIANEQYKLYNFDQLDTDDQITSLFADNFVSLMMCKEWIDLTHELKKDGVIPTQEDFDHLISTIRAIQEWKLYLRGLLNAAARHEIRYEQYLEFKTYITFNEARLSAALDALAELKYISKCTETMFQVQKKIRMTIQMDKMPEQMANYHKTMIDVPFLNVYDQETNIESNVTEKPEPSEEYLSYRTISQEEAVSLNYDQDSLCEATDDYCQC